MKGLDQYIIQHGRHFTTELAEDAVTPRWASGVIQQAAQNKVYYNVTGSTLGDMVYLTNKRACFEGRKDKCIQYALSVIGNFQFNGGVVFETWLKDLEENDVDFDFSFYV